MLKRLVFATAVLMFATPASFGSQAFWASAVGLPELNPGFGRIVNAGEVAVPSIEPAPVPAESPYLVRARAMYERLLQAGYVKVDAVFLPNTDPKYSDTPAYVMYDFPRSVCNVFIGDKGMDSYNFRDDFLFGFVIYHELAHCHLYANPREIRAFPSLSDRANRMVSDLVYLEFLQMGEGDTDKVNGYNAYHEVYADVKSTAILAAEGWAEDRLQEIVRFRERTAFPIIDTHDNVGVFGHVLSVPWGVFDPERLDAEARAIADAYIVANFFRKVYRPHVWDVVTLREVLACSLRTPIAELHYAETPAEIRAALERRFAQAAAAPQPAWREYTYLVSHGAGEGEIVGAFFEVRYGAGPKDLADDDAAIREALKAAF